MKKIIEYIKNNYKIIFAILLVLGAFCWFQVRPAHVKSICAQWALVKAQYPDDKTQYDQDFYDDYYPRCLHEHGL